MAFEFECSLFYSLILFVTLCTEKSIFTWCKCVF